MLPVSAMPATAASASDPPASPNLVVLRVPACLFKNLLPFVPLRERVYLSPQIL